MKACLITIALSIALCGCYSEKRAYIAVKSKLLILTSIEVCGDFKVLSWMDGEKGVDAREIVPLTDSTKLGTTRKYLRD